MQQSCVFGIMINEATDITTTSSLIVYAYLVTDGARKMRLLADAQLSQCDASAIVTAISNVYGVKMNKCFGFGSNGRSVMTGLENGVTAILKKENPYLIAIHCVAHRQASSQAAAKSSTIVQYSKTLSAIYGYFLHSTVHTQELLAVQKMPDEPKIKMKRLYDV